MSELAVCIILSSLKLVIIFVRFEEIIYLGIYVYLDNVVLGFKL